jgi:hypothetical protein
MRFAEREFYHIYNRGVESRSIFSASSDYKRFLKGLLFFNTDKSIEIRNLPEAPEILSPERRLVSVVSYALMKNHVHLLVRCNSEQGLAKFLQKVFIGYTMYFNTKHNRRGVLFQGGSQSKHITNNRYLTHVVDYIHLNPLDYVMPEWRQRGIKNVTECKKTILEYPYSSLKGVLKEEQNSILDTKLINELFPNTEEVLSSMLEWSSEIFEVNKEFLLE